MGMKGKTWGSAILGTPPWPHQIKDRWVVIQERARLAGGLAREGYIAKAMGSPRQSVRRIGRSQQGSAE